MDHQDDVIAAAIHIGRSARECADVDGKDGHDGRLRAVRE